MGRILREGKRTVTVAMDHGIVGMIKGIENLDATITEIIDGGADALLVNPGVAKRFSEKISGKAGLIVTIPWDERYVEAAVRLGAEAVKTTYFGPIPLTIDSPILERFSAVGRGCDNWGVPYMAEVVPTDPKGRMIADVELIAKAARIGFEAGAVIVKTSYAGTPDLYREAVKACPVPIVVLGGPRMDRDVDVLKIAREAVDAGAVGVAVGRNVWQHRSPAKMTRALVQIVHEGAKVDDAAKGLA